VIDAHDCADKLHCIAQLQSQKGNTLQETKQEKGAATNSHGA
jgi:hypothetical protein